MAKDTGKKVSVVADDEDEDAVVVKAAPVASKDKDPEADKAPAKVSVTADESDSVTVTMLETIDPAPRVGHWKGVDEIKGSKLLAKKSYRVPRHVAVVLEEAGSAVSAEIPSVEN